VERIYKEKSVSERAIYFLLLLYILILCNIGYLSHHILIVLVKYAAVFIGDRLEVNADKTKHMVMSRDQNAGRSHSMKINTRSFERVEEFKCLGTTLTNQNSIQEESESRLKSGNAFYLSVQNLLSSSLLSKNLKIQIYTTIILPVVLYGCETWSLTLREERRLRVFENRVLRRILGPKRVEVIGEWRKLHNEELNT